MGLRTIFKKYSSAEKAFRKQIKLITGVNPVQLEYYQLAFTHKSVSESNHNERLEFLGDAILNSIVSKYLYKTFEDKDEGQLTQLRSRLVSRSHLNQLALELGISDLVDLRKSVKIQNSSIPGNTLEALIGAIYLDKGIRSAHSFVVNILISEKTDFENILNTTVNFKSKLLEYCQKEKIDLHYRVKSDTKKEKPFYKATVVIEGKEMLSGKGTSKKKAEQEAAKATFNHLINTP